MQPDVWVRAAFQSFVCCGSFQDVSNIADMTVMLTLSDGSVTMRMTLAGMQQ